MLPPLSTFNNPVAVSSDGTHVWVVNGRGNSVTELDAATGGLVQVIQGPSYGFDNPDAVSSDGTHVWVANPDNSVTELDAATGELVRVISAGTPPSNPENYLPTAEFDWPTAICSTGTNVWVLNNNLYTYNWSVTELVASTGAFANLVVGPTDATSAPYMGLSCDATHAWVQNEGYTTGQYPNQQSHLAFLQEIDAASGTVVQTMSDASLGLNGALGGVSSDGTHVWVLGDSTDGPVAELDASTGALVRTISLPAYMNAPLYITSDGSHVWVKSFTNNLLELDASTGAFVRDISDPGDGGYVDTQKLSSDGTHVWVVSSTDQSLTEFDAATGALVQVVPVNAYGFANPMGVSSDGRHVWVADVGTDSVTELDAWSGALVRVISGPSYGFGFPNWVAAAPTVISSDGTHVWVANDMNNSVTELDASSGALVRVIAGTSYGFNGPNSVSSDGTHVWVGNSNSVTELDASTGALVQVLSDRSYGFVDPGGIDSDGTHVWVANGTHWVGTGWSPFTLTELDATTGALVRVISGIAATDISSDGTHVWVDGGTAVTELDASTGAIVRTITPSGLNYSQAISSDGTDVWVANSGSNSVMELDAATGAVVQVVSGSTYGFDFPTGISSDGINVWVTNEYANSVTELATGQLAQRIIFTSTPPSNPLPGGQYTVSATGGASGNPVVFSIDNSATSVCSVSGQIVSFAAPGTCVIDANQAAGNGYPAAPQAQQSFVVGAQRITFTSTPPSNGIVGGPTYTVSATGGASGNPVVFSIDASATSVCSITGQIVSFDAPGWCIIDANQAGDSEYGPAPQAKQSFVVGAQKITFTSFPGVRVADGPSYTVTATGGGSGNPVVFSSTDPAVCTVSGSTVSFVNGGWCTIAANQAGNADYSPAPTAFQSALVTGGSLSVATTSVADPVIGMPFSSQLQGVAGTPPYRWKLLKGTRLPRGIHLNHKTGVLSGTAKARDALGTYSVTVLLRDAKGSVVQQTLSITMSQLPPTITSLSRSTGPAGGGRKVRIRGTNLEHATSVLFGTTPATIVKVNGNGTVAKVLAPPGAPGPVPITITTPAGTTSSPMLFSYT